MASLSMAMPLTSATQRKFHHNRTTESFIKRPLLPFRPPSKAAFFSGMTNSPRAGFKVQASLREKAVTGLTAAALTASMVIPEVAEAAGSGVSPSLKNFLLSIAAGGVVLSVIIGAVVGVSNFDPVKRA